MADIVSLSQGMEIQPENIPVEFKSKDRWFLWKWVNRAGKTTKPPFQPNGKAGMVNDPSTWSSFETVLKVLAESKQYHGLGFVLSEEDDIIAWDLDHCLDPKTGEVEEWANRIITTLNSYTEITPSGEGLRVFVRGDLPVSGRKKGNVECYKARRYITITGNLYPGFPTELAENSLELFEESFSKSSNNQEKEKKKSKKNKNNDTVIQIDLLTEGKWKEAGYPSQSEADYDYCKYLADKVGGDAQRMDEEFRKTKLFRPKWDTVHSGGGSTYGQLTIELALKGWQTQFRYTDIGNAKRLTKLIKDEAKYCYGRWYIWDGKRLGEDKLRYIYILAQRVLAELKEEAKTTVDDDLRKSIWKHLVQLESKNRFEAMISLAQSQEEIAMHAEDLDKDPFLFNCENGILDQYGKIRSHAFEELITKLAPVNINTKATCPNWEKFLDEVIPDKEIQDFLQRAVGYSMTGDITEQVLFFAYGTGQNGKSTFFHIITKIFGDYASQLPVESLMASKSDQHPTILADLRGVRFVLASEPEDGRRFNEGLLKQITGGEKIVARRMREDFTRFDSTAKLWIMGNHKPTIRGTDYAIWRRIRLIPFTVTIPKEKQDKELWNKLESELEGILLWCIKGLQKWLKHGLEPPSAVIAATEEYRQEMDVLQDFLNEEIEPEIGNWVLHSSVYAIYAKRAQDGNERVLSSKSFAQKMREKGFKDQRRTGNQLYWADVRLKNIQNESVQRDL